MSNTFRKDKHGKTFKEGQLIKDKTWKCDCYLCVGADKVEIKEKIAEKELKEEVRIIEKGENIDYDISEQEEIVKQIFGRT